MAGRIYWEKLRPLVPANATTVNNALAADPTLSMYAKLYYRRRYANARASMGFGPSPFEEDEDTQPAP
jgi:hypothetical protein